MMVGSPSPSATTGRSDSSHRSMPPLTLIASKPLLFSHWATWMLRPPVRQTMYRSWSSSGSLSRFSSSELAGRWWARSEEHTSELQSRGHLVCRLLLEKKKRDKKENKDEEEVMEEGENRKAQSSSQ